MNRHRSLQANPIQTEQPQRAIAEGSRARAGLRLAARCAGTALLVALGSGLAGGCSDALECKPTLPEGAVYKVTLLEETPKSAACHVVAAKNMSPFLLTVGKTEPNRARPDCSVTPAAAAPAQLDDASEQLRIISCSPSETQMLGLYCEIEYKAGCLGHVHIYFAAPPEANVNWGAPVIDGLLFQVADQSPACFADFSNCVDEYKAKLERMQ